METRQTGEINGLQLYNAFRAGVQRVSEHRKLLNDINVFPVADADTGTNLVWTLRYMTEAAEPVIDAKKTAVALADAALTGARGNSGIIFAQFLYGFSNELPGNETLNIASFAESMKQAVRYAYDAISNPVEGTILTVIADWADCLYTLHSTTVDFTRLFSEAYQRALESLAATTGQLAQLAQAKVVDAGAKGFVFFLEGIVDYFLHGDLEQSFPEDSFEKESTEPPHFTHEKISCRYCTEVLISADLLDKKAIAEKIGELGDSMVIAGSPQKLHVHLHTDRPDQMIGRLQQMGTVSYQKADDMVLQQELRLNRKSDIALLTDSGCDLPANILEQYQIHVIPFTIHFADEFYLDRITLMPLEFYDRLKSSTVRPTTAQPSIKEFRIRYEYLVAQYQSVIAIHFSEQMTSTCSTSSKVAEEVARESGKRIDVVSSASLSGGEGLLVLRAAQAIASGASHEEIMQQVPDWRAKIILRAGFDSLGYIVKSGRVSPLKGIIGKTLDLKPAIYITREGKAEVFSAAFTGKGSLKKVVQNITRAIEGKPVWGYAITHAKNLEKMAYYSDYMERLTGQKPLFVEYSTPAIIANTGPGVCISVMME